MGLALPEDFWPSNESLELAAQAAEDWKNHGINSCEGNWKNEDGFL